MGHKRKTQQRPDAARSPRATATAPDDVPTSALARGLGGAFFSEAVSLKLLVFWAGAVLMGLEIAGSRVLAPYYGNSVFVWGSLISVFLIAISCGNYLGGRIADRYPARLVLNFVCIGVSVWIFVIAVVAPSVCQSLVQGGVGEEVGPLVASLLLFLPPSVGMGVVSPFAIRLAAESLNSVGKISGTFYALSTMGSIAGTLLTTFVLIPLIGVTAILKGLGLALLAASVLTLPFRRPGRSRAPLAALSLAALFCFFLTGPAATPLFPGERRIVDLDSPYQHIAVVDNTVQGSRDLKFDHFVESSILKTPPYRSLSDYTDYFNLAFLAHPKVSRVLFIGAGGAIGARAFHMHDPNMEIDVVDIDAKVLEIARDYFYLQDSPVIRTIAEDGRIFLRKSKQKYDCIILDAFTIGGRIPFHLVTREFFELCRDRMTDGGVFIMNINSALDGRLSRIFASVHGTIEAVFPNTYVFARSYGPRAANQSMNIILLASNQSQRITPDQWSARADSYESNSYIKREKMQSIAQSLVVDVPRDVDVPILTDDYAPIETMPF
jgi:spermidine synthase